MGEETWIEGAISVEAVIQAQSREVHGVYVRRGEWDGTVRRLLKTAALAQVEVTRVDPDFIDSRASGRSHGGIIAQVGPRKFASLDDLLQTSNTPFVVMLDGIEDPFNFGQAVRSLYAAGAAGVVVRPRNWLSAAGVVTRASAGASAMIPMAVAPNAMEAAAFYKAQGLTIACTAMEKATSIYKVDLTIPLFFLIGGEKRGITRSFLDSADLRLKIPYQGEFPHSLGTAASTAILAFEVMRQRQEK